MSETPLPRSEPHVTAREGLRVADLPVEIRRSARRRRSVQARVEGEVLVVLMPAGLTPAQEQAHVASLRARLAARDARQQARDRYPDAELERRARWLGERYLGGRAVPRSVRWVTNQSTRWGSCTPSTGQIRLSHRLQGMPQYVVDDVLVHELAHLLEPGHGPRFHALVARHPRHAEATAFLAGVCFGRGRPGLQEDDVDDGVAGGIRGIGAIGGDAEGEPG